MRLLLLLIPCVLALWAPLYNTEPPALFGIPFFYWFQLLLIPGVGARNLTPRIESGSARDV